MRPLRRIAIAAAALTALTTVAACSTTGSADQSTATRQLTDTRGTVTVPTRPTTAYVADWAALDTLAALEVPVAGATLTRIPDDLKQKFTGAEDLGTPQELKLEQVAAGEPDVIVVGARATGQYDKLTEIAPTVDLTPTTTSHLDALEQQTTILGELFGKQREAADRLAGIDTLIQDTRGAVAGKGDALVLMVSGGKISAFGPGSRFGLIHDDLGMPAAAPDLKVDAHGQVVSYEFIATADPDWIFVIDRDKAIGQSGTPAAQVLDTDLVNRTTAGREGHIVPLDGVEWYVIGNGLNTTRSMIDDVRTAVAG